MKTYSLEEIKKMSEKNPNYIAEDYEDEKDYTIEELDKAKTKILKYILYKKRTESEVRKKFSREFDENIIDDIIEEFRENGYLNDENYITRAVDEFIALRNLSIKEIKFKLIAKGIKTKDLDNYFSINDEKLSEYEKKSAYNIVQKKKSQMEELELKRYLMKKGYREESIKEAL